MRRLDRVVGAAENDRRKHLLAVNIAGESARFSNERPDDVAVVDSVEIAATKTLAIELVLVGIANYNPVLEDAHAHPFADESRGNRVRAMFDAHGAPVADSEVLFDEFGKSGDVEFAHRLHVFGDAPAAAPVGLAHDVVDERLPRTSTIKIATSADEQRLLESALQRSVCRLDVAVLLLRTDLRRARLQCRMMAR